MFQPPFGMGITPACAGKSSRKDAGCIRSRDHPRMCGEKVAQEILQNCNEGSPPHVRGKDALPRSKSASVGITPACAGKRDLIANITELLRDHPRMCGEKDGPYICRSITVGITPACAGKRRKSCAGQPPEWDHPRMCGEKSSITPPTTGMAGSPPHVRGKGRRRSSRAVQAGITPACAGKSLQPLLQCCLQWDHPRMCGEKCVA